VFYAVQIKECKLGGRFICLKRGKGIHTGIIVEMVEFAP
jgi:hypothetical protein